MKHVKANVEATLLQIQNMNRMMCPCLTDTHIYIYKYIYIQIYINRHMHQPLFISIYFQLPIDSYIQLYLAISSFTLLCRHLSILSYRLWSHLVPSNLIQLCIQEAKPINKPDAMESNLCYLRNLCNRCDVVHAICLSPALSGPIYIALSSPI